MQDTRGILNQHVTNSFVPHMKHEKGALQTEQRIYIEVKITFHMNVSFILCLQKRTLLERKLSHLSAGPLASSATANMGLPPYLLDPGALDWGVSWIRSCFQESEGTNKCELVNKAFHLTTPMVFHLYGQFSPNLCEIFPVVRGDLITHVVLRFSCKREIKKATESMGRFNLACQPCV